MDFMDFIWLGTGILLGVVFDEFFTTKFQWVTTEGRQKLKDMF